MQTRKNTGVLIMTFAALLSLGLAVSVIGPLLPAIAEVNQASLAETGGILSVFFVGALLSTTLAGPVSDRFGYKIPIAASLLVMAAGLAGFTTTRTLWQTMAFVFITGLGHGGVDVLGNLLTARIYGDKNVEKLNLLHFFFGVGAFAGPAIVSLMITLTGSGFWVPRLVAVLAVVLGCLFFTRAGIPLPLKHQHDVAPFRQVFRSPVIWLFAVLLLVYVGTENGMGGWITSFTGQATGASVEVGALISSGFWALLTVGRLIIATIGARFTPRTILLACLAGSSAGGALFFAGNGSLWMITGSVLLMGLSFGGIFPTVISLVTARYPHHSGKAVSLVTSLGSIGGMVIPWLQGIILVEVSPVASTAFIFGLCILMLVTGILATPVGATATVHRDGIA